MKKSTAEVGPQMVLEVSDTEQFVAKDVKNCLKDILDKLDTAVDSVTKLTDAIISQRPSKDDLKTKYKGRLIRYKKKIRDVFNKFLSTTKAVLEKLSDISDPEMIRLREVIIAEVGEISDGAEALLDLLEEPERDEFTKTLEQLSAQISKRKKSIVDVIDNQLYNHLDHDILGKMKLSKVRYNILRRSRIVSQIVRRAK